MKITCIDRIKYFWCGDKLTTKRKNRISRALKTKNHNELSKIRKEESIWLKLYCEKQKKQMKL